MQKGEIAGLDAPRVAGFPELTERSEVSSGNFQPPGGASNPGLTEPASMFSFYPMPFG